ncbi:hypothetical protein COLO4_31322 [Corchorus olitorius]|uniref:Protein CHUP1, chloroplastic n=1 Tax=Corchorus olitorius TaxID=93759 RepID=A0A1R3H4S0_9ROSI|nr:hypothetical protein COLO4_31322 [Corchorus olitorius]
MGLQKSPSNPKHETPPPKPPLPSPSSGNNKNSNSSKAVFSRSFGVYFPRSSAQVQPRPPDVTELLRLVEELRDRESRLKTELLEHKLLKESVAIVPVLENEIVAKNAELEQALKEIENLRNENETLKTELVEMKGKMEEERNESEKKVREMEEEIAELKKTVSSYSDRCSKAEITMESDDSLSASQRFQGLVEVSVKSNLIKNLKRNNSSKFTDAIVGMRAVSAKVRRIPEVVEFYHSLMRRDSKREAAGPSVPESLPATANARDMIGEIENRSAHLLAIKTDVETQGDFIKFLIKEVENVAFTDIEDVVPFVKWLDDELSYLVDERAVLKHFEWPEQKADALREAAFGYCDLKKLESEASSFRDDARQPCGPALKKMQALLEKLEHGLYNLSRMKESATNRYKGFQIPTDWMLETGIVSQIKLASVKLAMKYMRRVSAELEAVGGGPEEEELIVQGVRFAFRVHQFAGGFDVETMRAFQELRDKARSCHVQCQNQQQKFICRFAFWSGTVEEMSICSVSKLQFLISTESLSFTPKTNPSVSSKSSVFFVNQHPPCPRFQRPIKATAAMETEQTANAATKSSTSNPPMKLLFVEMGVGYDQHGQDITSAAMRACRDAISSNSIPAFRRGSIPGVSFEQMKLMIKLGVPHSLQHSLDIERVKSVFPYGKILDVEVVDGGLICSSGVEVEEMGDKNDDCYIVNAAVYVGY